MMRVTLIRIKNINSVWNVTRLTQGGVNRFTEQKSWGTPGH